MCAYGDVDNDGGIICENVDGREFGEKMLAWKIEYVGGVDMERSLWHFRLWRWNKYRVSNSHV